MTIGLSTNLLFCFVNISIREFAILMVSSSSEFRSLNFLIKDSNSIIFVSLSTFKFTCV